MLLEKIELEPSEKVICTVRKHWFVIFGELIGSFLMVIIPLIAIIIFGLTTELPPAVVLVADHFSLAAYGLSLWILFSLLTGFMIWTHYYLDLWLITDRRIIVIDQVKFFNRKVSSFRLERLQDVKATINGILPTFLNFGTLHAHTAGNTEENFTSSGLPDPRGLQAIIQKATDERLRILTDPQHIVD
jgi:hypothetical protein